MKVYIAGPMRGYPGRNFAAFADARARLREQGHVVLCPAENASVIGENPEAPVDPLLLQAAFRWDVEAVLAVEAVVLLPGWENSVGARLEFDIAKAIGTPAYPLDHFIKAAEIAAQPITTGA